MQGHFLKPRKSHEQLKKQKRSNASQAAEYLRGTSIIVLMNSGQHGKNIEVMTLCCAVLPGDLSGLVVDGDLNRQCETGVVVSFMKLELAIALVGTEGDQA